MAQSLKRTGVYPRRTFSNDILQKAPTMVLLTEIRPKVCVTTLKTILSYSYNYLEETLDHLESIILNIYPGENFVYYCTAILVDSEFLQSTGDYLHILGYF